MVFRRRSSAADQPPADGADPFTQEALSYVDSLYGTAMRLTRRVRGCRRPGPGHLPEGVSLFVAVQAWDEPEGVAVHDPAQHVPEHAPARRAQSGGRRQRGGRAAPPTSAGRSRRRSSCSRGRRSTRTCRPRSIRLPEAFRQAVWLRDVEEFSYAEIAAMIQVPIGTVMSRISRGRRMLYERLATARMVETG